MTDDEFTTIRISVKNRDKLAKLVKNYDDEMDDIISRLLP